MSPDINREGTHVTIAHIRKVVTSNPRKLLRKCEGNPQTSNVKLSKSFPHKHLNKSLHSSYQLTGKALVHGTPSRVTNAAINCESVRNHHTENTGYFEEGSIGTLLYYGRSNRF